MAIFEIVMLFSVPVLIYIFSSFFKSSVRRDTSFPKVDPLEPFKDPQKQAFFQWLCEEATRQTRVDVEKDALAKKRLKEAFSKAVKELENAETAEISLPFFAIEKSVPCHFKITLSRADRKIFMEDK